MTESNERIAADILIALLGSDSGSRPFNAEQTAAAFQEIYNQVNYCSSIAEKSDLGKEHDTSGPYG